MASSLNSTSSTKGRLPVSYIQADPTTIYADRVGPRTTSSLGYEPDTSDDVADTGPNIFDETPSKSDPSYQGGSLKRPGFVNGVIGKMEKNSLLFYEFQFNPNQLTGTFAANWTAHTPAASIKPYGSFMFMEPTPLEFELFLDDTDANKFQAVKRTINGQYLGVSADIFTLASFLNPNVANVTFQADGKLESPSPVYLSFGPTVFKTMFNSVQWTITQWTSQLIPTRATAALKFTVLGDSQQENFNYMKTLQNSISQNGMLQYDTSFNTRTSL